MVGCPTPRRDDVERPSSENESPEKTSSDNELTISTILSISSDLGSNKYLDDNSKLI